MAKWLTISDVQNLLHVPESTIQRWVRQGICLVLNVQENFISTGRFCFHGRKPRKSMLKKRPVQKKPSRIEKHNWQELKKAMERGGLHQLEGGSDWKTLFREATGLLNYDTTIQNQVFEQLVQREELSSTALGNGIAIPHPRIPMKLELRESLVLSLFLNQPVDLRAADQKPVYSLFFLLSCEAGNIFSFSPKSQRFFTNLPCLNSSINIQTKSSYLSSFIKYWRNKLNTFLTHGVPAGERQLLSRFQAVSAREALVMMTAALVLGIAAGILSVGLNWSVHALREFSQNLGAGWLAILFPAIGAGLAVFMIRSMMKDFSGHGVSDVITAMTIGSERLPRRMIFPGFRFTVHRRQRRFNRLGGPHRLRRWSSRSRFGTLAGNE